MAQIFNEILGTEVRIPEAPTRIVSFSPAATETLFEIGAGESVVGVSAFCARPPEANQKRKVGSYNTVREEVLDELRPDLILAVTGYQREFAFRLAKKYPVYPLELPVSVAGIVDFVVKVGLVTGLPDRARELATSLMHRIGELGSVPKLRAYEEIDLGGPVTFGAYSYITDAFRVLGCSTLCEDERNEWLTPDLEAIAAEDPDVIIYESKMFMSFDTKDLQSLVESRGWTGLKAVKAGNVFLTPRPLDFLAHHGPSFVTIALPWLEETLRMAGRNLG
ncbi:MAG: ABC transporter substrate-binding protein [Thaumarchaeota archaeon]|nr:ABC transporter substrate-binding protein [Nitrososphaerota archaeon]